MRYSGSNILSSNLSITEISPFDICLKRVVSPQEEHRLLIIYSLIIQQVRFKHRLFGLSHDTQITLVRWWLGSIIFILSHLEEREKKKGKSLRTRTSIVGVSPPSRKILDGGVWIRLLDRCDDEFPKRGPLCGPFLIWILYQHNKFLPVSNLTTLPKFWPLWTNLLLLLFNFLLILDFTCCYHFGHHSYNWFLRIR